MIGYRFKRFWMVPLPPAYVSSHLCGPEHGKSKVLLDCLRRIDPLELFQRTVDNRELILRVKIFPEPEAVP
jgi:hypothetical protein